MTSEGARVDRLAALKALDLDPRQPFTFTSEMTIRPTHLSEFTIALRATTEIARSQPACVFIFANQSVLDPCVFLMFERWSSLSDFEEQETLSEWFREYLAATDAAHAAPRVVRAWADLFAGP